MPFRAHTLAALRGARSRAPQLRVVAGFDGFVDTIVEAVDRRSGPGKEFTGMPDIPAFARRIGAAAGKSTNIELYPHAVKLGGNGPIMAAAQLAHGAHVTYLGALGSPVVHPVFTDFAARAEVISIAQPAQTTAVEFTDGKIMLGQTSSLDDITLERIESVMGADVFARTIARANLFALVNWTMIPHMTALFTGLTRRVLPALSPRTTPLRFFFDLADPEKRHVVDLRAALEAIMAFEAHGRVTLGLNLKEAQQVYFALGLGAAADVDSARLEPAAAAIRNHLRLDTVVIHPRECAACATPDGTALVPGPYTTKPLITTGAGDHFNAGFTTGQLLGLDATACLTVGVCTSGHYVRTGQSPTLDDLETFLANWRA